MIAIEVSPRLPISQPGDDALLIANYLPGFPRDRPSSDFAIREGAARVRLRQEDPLRSRAHVFVH
jgi:hypothetical protein